MIAERFTGEWAACHVEKNSSPFKPEQTDGSTCSSQRPCRERRWRLPRCRRSPRSRASKFRIAWCLRWAQMYSTGLSSGAYGGRYSGAIIPRCASTCALTRRERCRMGVWPFGGRYACGRVVRTDPTQSIIIRSCRAAIWGRSRDDQGERRLLQRPPNGELGDRYADALLRGDPRERPQLHDEPRGQRPSLERYDQPGAPCILELRRTPKSLPPVQPGYSPDGSCATRRVAAVGESRCHDFMAQHLCLISVKPCSGRIGGACGDLLIELSSAREPLAPRIDQIPPANAAPGSPGQRFAVIYGPPRVAIGRNSPSNSSEPAEN
jgi:hypothetical protein